MTRPRLSFAHTYPRLRSNAPVQFGLGLENVDAGFRLMKRWVTALVLGYLILLQGLPLIARAQGEKRHYLLPASHLSEPYNVSLEGVLRETYRLRLVQDGSAFPNFKWFLAAGGLPSGLSLDAQGVIKGKPTEYRTQPYVFQVRIIDTTLSNAEAIEINFSLTAKPPRPRLVSVSTPRLIPIEEKPMRTKHPSVSEPSTSPDTSYEPSSARTPPQQSESVEVDRSVTPQATGIGQRLSVSVNEIGTGLFAAVTAPAPVVPLGPPAPCALPKEFEPPTGADVITVDVPTRTAKDGSGRTINLADQMEYKRGTVVRIVFDNKNPYLYQSKYTRESKLVTEQAIAALLPALGGVIAGFLPAPPKEEAKAASKPTPAPGVEAALNDPCAGARAAVENLNQELTAMATQALGIETTLPGIKAAAESLAKTYQEDRDALYVFGRKRPDLYCDTTKLLSDTENGIGDANAKALGAVQKNIGLIKSLADVVPERVKLIEDTYDSTCLDQYSLLRVQLYAKGLSASADGYQKTVDDIIKGTLDKVKASRKALQDVLKDPYSFFEVQTEGGGSTTKTVDGKLTLTPLKDVSEATAVDPITISLKFGGAPFFSLSGGLLFSPLRKREYVRIQGFERDQQGNPVLTNSNPNLTTVVGLKEDSPTRIIPAVFLNGRVKGFTNSYVDAVHISLGITAKNDNKGTDLEFLVGPSFSMFERNLFLTVGGFAGRQQKLGGGLFEGFAVPSTVDELPIQKNYRWSLGFAMSYRLPVTK